MGLSNRFNFLLKLSYLFLSTPGLRDHYIYKAQICCHDWLISGLEHVFFHVLGIIIQLTVIFFRRVETTNQLAFSGNWGFEAWDGMVSVIFKTKPLDKVGKLTAGTALICFWFLWWMPWSSPQIQWRLGRACKRKFAGFPRWVCRQQSDGVAAKDLQMYISTISRGYWAPISTVCSLQPLDLNVELLFPEAVGGSSKTRTWKTSPC